MTSRTKVEDEQSSQPPSLLTSLPDDIVVDILARVPRQDYPTLSLVSKQFRSIVTSHEIYARRSLLGCTEHCLYVLLYEGVGKSCKHLWYILQRKANGYRRLVLIPSLSDLPSQGSFVAAGSMIYGFGATVDDRIVRPLITSSSAFRIDCRSQTVQPFPNMPIPLADTGAGFLDGKFYVFGLRRMKSEVMVVFNTETQMWEPGLIKPAPTPSYTRGSGCMAVMADKIYSKYIEKGFVYVPKENRWETDEVLNSKEWNDGSVCVVDNILYYYDCSENSFSRYDPKEKRWEVVKGLEELVAEIRLPFWTHLVRFGQNLALFFYKEEDESSEGTEMIWCAEISLGRSGGEIWGKVEWCDRVVTVGKVLSVKSLDVIV